MIHKQLLQQLDVYDVLIASYATQQTIIRAAATHSMLIRPRLLTPQEAIEMVTYKAPSTWEGVIHQQLGLEPGFASVVLELLRSDAALHSHIPESIQQFGHAVVSDGTLRMQRLLSPHMNIGLLGPIPKTLATALVGFQVSAIDWSSLDSTIEYTMFDTQYEEVVAVLDDVARVIESQPIDSVALLVAEPNYRPLLDVIASRYDIPIQWQEGIPIIQHPKVAAFYDSLMSNVWSMDDYLEHLGSLLVDEDDTLQGIYTQLIRFASNYQSGEFEPSTLQAVLHHQLHHLTYRPTPLKHVLKIYRSTSQYIDADYVIVLGVNQGVFPAVSTSSLLVSDATRSAMQLSTNADKTAHAMNEFLWFCKLKQHLWITAKHRSLDKVYAPSILFASANPQFLYRTKDITFDQRDRYSKTQDLLQYKKELHRQRRQGFYSDELEFLNHQWKSALPEPYVNTFKGISPGVMKEFPAPEVTSYSSLNTFFNCQFRYWMQHVLSVDPFEESLSLYLGNLVHYVLKELGHTLGGEEYEDKIQLFANEYIHDVKDQLNSSMLFYLYHIIPYVKRAVMLLQQFQTHSKFELQFIEQSMSYGLRNSLVTLRGVVDHVSMYESPSGTQHVVIVDYKTGKSPATYAKIEYGIDVQLFVYMLLVRETHLVDDPYFSGAFQFSILPQKIPQKVEGKSFQDQIDEQLGFDGFVEDNLKTYQDIYDNNDRLFKIALTKQGEFNKNFKKRYDQGQLHQYLDYLSAQIELASINIQQGEYTINPKVFYTGKKETLSSFSDTSCNYCHLKDVCYRTEEDFTKVTKNSKVTFGDLLETILEKKEPSS
jgi:ATP-dependent helicase/DNAse subunit B